MEQYGYPNRFYDKFASILGSTREISDMNDFVFNFRDFFDSTTSRNDLRQLISYINELLISIVANSFDLDLIIRVLFCFKDLLTNIVLDSQHTNKIFSIIIYLIDHLEKSLIEFEFSCFFHHFDRTSDITTIDLISIIAIGSLKHCSEFNNQEYKFLFTKIVDYSHINDSNIYLDRAVELAVAISKFDIDFFISSIDSLFHLSGTN